MSWFDRNADAYEEQLPKLLEKYENKFVVLRNAEIVHICDTQQQAMEFGYREYQLTEFLTKQVLRSDLEMLQEECRT